MTDLASIGIVDLMIGFPSAEASRHYEGIRALTKDTASQDMEFPAEYMFRGVPNQVEDGRDPVETTLEAMDKNGIAIGMVSLGNESTTRALELHPDRFAPSLEIDPNDIGGAVKRVRESHQRHRAIIDYAKSRGTEKIMYAGYYPMELSLDRIFAELPDVPLRDHVWEPFLRDNAHRVFALGAAP